MSANDLTIFGEVLFDCFPSGESVLGGAPFNVAWHLQAFGRSPRFISRIGRDEAGDAVLRAMRQWGMDTNPLQSDDFHPTGKVMISLLAGEPSYDILADAAYDFIDAARLAEVTCATLYHGSLGLRNPVARTALERLKANRPRRIFMDVNLRDPWWQRETVLEWVSQADWVKLNEDELRLLQGHSSELSVDAGTFMRRHGLEGVVVTRGEQGALALLHDRSVIEITPEKHLDLIDTVGAGDGFSAVLLLGLTLDWPLRLTLERAQAFASAIVGQRGATVKEPSFYQTFADDWQLA
ncbi:MAG: carbohydrate kinase [Candidatus Thiodiazotropha sp. (ex Epidulcina cf. delphinae)]|nr:carbohydrate kinase [Candidatus Thiodiazotropha sp. (ex Epidulcina cf. delphinae)]